MMRRARLLPSLAFAAVLLLAIGSLVVFTRIGANEDRADEIRQVREDGFALIDELRQTSDDLTRMARLYAVTGEERYRGYFRDILGIRAGQLPRPIDYGRIYWDLVVATGEAPRGDSGVSLAMDTLVVQAGLTRSELSLFLESELNSNYLAILEQEAMSAVTDDDLEFARELLHGAEYHERKAQIMAPLDDLLTAFDERTAADLAENADERDTLWTILSILTGAMIALSVAGVVIVATGWPRKGA